MNQIGVDGFDVISILNTFAFSQKRNIGKSNRQTLVRLGQYSSHAMNLVIYNGIDWKIE